MNILQSHLIWINIVLIFIILLIHLRIFQWNTKIISIILFLIGSLCYQFYLLMVLYEMYHYIGWLFFNGMNLISYFFWLFSLSLFNDNFKINQFSISIGILKFFVGNMTLILSYFNSDLKTMFLMQDKTYYLQIPNILFSLILILHSLYIAYKEKDSDLVILRIDVRKFFIFSIGIFIIWVFLYYLVLRPLSFTLIFNLINLFLILFLCILFLIFGYPYLSLLQDNKTSNKKSDKYTQEFSEELLKQIIDMFEIKKIYREEGLTIRKLATYLNIQEYKLRIMIHQGLNYKNFNDLLNTYRIKEAMELLLDPNKSDLSITRIALDVGYPNAAVFNRAFKAFTGTTPSEFRKKPHQFRN